MNEYEQTASEVERSDEYDALMQEWHDTQQSLEASVRFN